jgi:hypothetical protein
LAAILFPVFAQAKVAAKKTVSISNMKQTVLAELMYQNDYDDSFVMADSGCTTNITGCIGWGFGPPDAVPAELTYPYTKNMDITIDPMSDLGTVTGREQTHFTYTNTVDPGEYPPNIAQGTPAQLEYAAGVRSNYGFNFAFLSPWEYTEGVTPTYLGSHSENSSIVTQPAHTVMYAGPTVWNTVGGQPTGGGNWVVQTPCWLDGNGNLLAPFNSISAPDHVFSYNNGWAPVPGQWDVYGGMWPFYTTNNVNAAAAAQNGQVIIGWVDGHTKAMAISATAAGCSAYGTEAGGGAPKGEVTNPSQFIWASNQ